MLLVSVGLPPEDALFHFIHCTQLLEVGVSLEEENDLGSFLHGGLLLPFDGVHVQNVQLIVLLESLFDNFNFHIWKPSQYDAVWSLIFPPVRVELPFLFFQVLAHNAKIIDGVADYFYVNSVHLVIRLDFA